ncbi:hypothetical protein FRC19_001125 [Serendipita sp. 401]|nr:hypothetical protein FRC19_001125 [Serendipita sp. 401]KAG9050903.1 hypothetical protein FS842_011293 [Serendipita sp. 407]
MADAAVLLHIQAIEDAFSAARDTPLDLEDLAVRLAALAAAVGENTAALSQDTLLQADEIFERFTIFATTALKVEEAIDQTSAAVAAEITSLLANSRLDDDSYEEEGEVDWVVVKDWFLANIAFPFPTLVPANLLPSDLSIDLDEFEHWVGHVRGRLGWETLFKRFANRSQVCMREICDAVFTRRVTSRGTSSRLDKATRRAFLEMRQSVEKACNDIKSEREQTADWINQLDAMIARLPSLNMTEYSDLLYDEDWVDGLFINDNSVEPQNSQSSNTTPPTIHWGFPANHGDGIHPSHSGTPSDPVPSPQPTERVGTKRKFDVYSNATADVLKSSKVTFSQRSIPTRHLSFEPSLHLVSDTPIISLADPSYRKRRRLDCPQSPASDSVPVALSPASNGPASPLISSPSPSSPLSDSSGSESGSPAYHSPVNELTSSKSDDCLKSSLHITVTGPSVEENDNSSVNGVFNACKSPGIPVPITNVVTRRETIKDAGAPQIQILVAKPKDDADQKRVKPPQGQISVPCKRSRTGFDEESSSSESPHSSQTYQELPGGVPSHHAKYWHRTRRLDGKLQRTLMFCAADPVGQSAQSDAWSDERSPSSEHNETMRPRKRTKLVEHDCSSSPIT